MTRTGITKKYPEEYRVFRTMHDRCEQPNNSSFYKYGARGIQVCDRWSGDLGFTHFIEDMGPRPEGKYPSGITKYSIDRIDNDGPYSPDNCRWATAKEQAYNRRPTVRVTIGSTTKTIDEWGKDSPVSKKLIYGRIHDGWAPEDAISKPLQRAKNTILNEEADKRGLKRRAVQLRVKEYGWSVEKALSTPIAKFRSPEDEAFQIEFNGKKQSIRSWSKEIGIAYDTLKARLLVRHWSVEDALTTPLNGRKPLYTLNGITKPLGDWARVCGVPYKILEQRVARDKMPLAEAMAKPVTRSRKGINTGPEHAKYVIEYEGEKYSISQFAKKLGYKESLVRERLYLRGWSLEDTIKTPPNGRRKTYAYKGKTKNIAEWAREYNIPVDRLRQRVDKLGKTIAEAIEMG